MTNNEHLASQSRKVIKTTLLHLVSCINSTIELYDDLSQTSETCESIEKEIALICDLYDIINSTQFDIVREAGILQTRSFELNAND